MSESPRTDGRRLGRAGLPDEVRHPLVRAAANVVLAGTAGIIALTVWRAGLAITLTTFPASLIWLTTTLLLIARAWRRTTPNRLGGIILLHMMVLAILGVAYNGFGPGAAVWLNFVVILSGILGGARGLALGFSGVVAAMTLMGFAWNHGIFPLPGPFGPQTIISQEPLIWLRQGISSVTGCAASALVVYFLQRWLLDYADQQRSIVATLAAEQELRAHAELERLQAEAKAAATARKSDARMRAVFQAAPIGIALLRERRIIEVNDRIVDLFGYTRAELIGQSTNILYADEETFHRFGQMIADAIKSTGVWEDQIQFFGRNRRPVDCLARIAPVDPADPGAGSVAMLFDLRERKRIEALRLEQARIEALARENARQLHEIFEHATEIIFVARVEPQGRFVYERINQACTTIGLNAADFCAGTKTPGDIFAPAAARIITEAYERCTIVRKPIMVDLAIPTPSGPRAFSTLLVPIIAEAGDQVVRIVGFARDQTERIQASLVLQQSEAKYRGMFENSVVGLFRIGPDGRAFSINAALARMYGYATVEEMLASVHDISSQIYAEPGQREVLRAELETRGRIDNIEVQVRRKDGSRMWVLTNAHITQDPVTGERNIEGSCIDVTERKQAIELRQAKAEAEAASRAKSAFLANMSHEIRTPMNAILGFSQLMLRDASLTPAQREHLQIIDRNGEHLLALINDVLEMSKIEARRIALRPAPFDLHAFVHDLDTMFASRARAKGLAFSVRGVSGLPAAALGDEGRLRQIFVNLIANAVKFTTSGSISVRLEAHDLRGDRWQLVGIVADTGPGIAPEEMKHLFKQFEQASAGRETGSGTGLGLSISRELARLMDGDITVSSRVGAGSEFRVSVPLGIVDQPLLRTTETDRRQVVGLAPGQPACRILVVDDIEDNRRLLATMLGDMGFQIREAADGAQAVEAFARWAPHAILMDLRMPVMDGNEATRRIRAMPGGAATRIICLTASVFTENREQMLAAGGDDFLSKPFHANQLVEKLGQLLGVRFDFAELRTDREAPDGTSAPAHAEPLPIHLVTALRQALDTADLDRALELIGLVGTHDAALAARLRTVAERFDYDGAVTLLARAPTRSEPE